MAGGTRNKADPFVISLAKGKNATVVTGEIGGTEKRPKIPYVCEDLKIPCITFAQLIKEEEWKF